MGDFVKGSVCTDLPVELQQHLFLHRRLDTYTTTSPAFQSSRRRLDPRFRYARAVLVDVFYDHFLARNWAQYSTTPLADFAQQVYGGLLSSYNLLPESLQDQLPRMIEYDWLTSYQYPDIVLRVLQRLEVRLQHKFPLAEGFAELERCQSGLTEDFAVFMRAAAEEVVIWKREFRKTVICST